MVCPLLALCLLTSAAASRAPRASGVDRPHSLLQARGQGLEGSGERDTPVTRVVHLLKEMQGTLQKEMKEDEELYDKLACWCNNNGYEKGNAISESQAKIAELEASIEGLTARTGNLDASIAELNGQVAADRAALAEATAVRKKQQKEFHGEELDSIQAIENLKAALAVLSKHHGSAPESTVAGGAIFKSERDSWASLLSVSASGKAGRGPWGADHEEARLANSLDEFMRRHGFEAAPETPTPLDESERPVHQHKFLQQGGGDAAVAWTPEDTAVVRRALKSVAGFVQAHHGAGYYPAYNSRSGEIVGVLQELKAEMEAALTEAQKREQASAASFAELRAAKASQVESGERMSEQKEDEHATAKNALAEAKEDHGQELASLSEDQQFLKNLQGTCAEASKNFQDRKSARLDELKAVSEAIEILMADQARDAMSGTYSLLQASETLSHEARQRRQAAWALRSAAKSLKDPQLSVLATSAELDSFAKVKKAIDDMVAMLKAQQDDEVKKNDYCKAKLQENEMATARQQDHKADFEAKEAQLSTSIQSLVDGITAAKAQIAQLQLELQRASEDRKQENLDFQKTVADQTVTVEVLKSALDKLATYYDKEALLQGTQHAVATRQTPPVPQMEYKPSKGASGVMQLLEKLIVEAKGLTAESVHSESEAQRAYEQTVADTNASVAALQKEVFTKTKVKAQTTKEKLQTGADIADAVAELEGLSKYNADLHAECDYLLKNFGARQEARAQEVEALQQAKQILSGASLS